MMVFLTINGFGQAQYLRDSTKFIFMDKAYPDNDSLVLKHYSDQETVPISLHPVFGIPEIEVKFDSITAPMFFDFGNSGNILITTAIEAQVDFSIIDTAFTYTPDGKIRGQVYSINIPEFEVLGQNFVNERAILSDWSIFSTEQINGIVGLNYVANKCFTLSYSRKILAMSDVSISTTVDLKKANIISLETYPLHPYGVYFSGRINDSQAVIYFDTGKNYSVISRKLVDDDEIDSDKSGSFYKGVVSVTFGEYTFEIFYPRVGELNRNIDTELPVGIDVGSDILRYFLITIDRTGGNNLLILHN